MLEILTFILSSFWIFIGSFFLIGITIHSIGWLISAVILALKGKTPGEFNIIKIR